MPTMIQNYMTILVLCLSVVSLHAKLSARLRGRHFDALEQMAKNPKIDATIRGKTLKELGIEESLNLNNEEDQARRELQSNEVLLKYFSVYDEFDTSVLTNLGETAGSRGMIYDRHAREDGLLEEYIDGALQGTCSLVTSDGKQLCSYEFFLLNQETGDLGTVVATGTVKNEVGTNSVLIIEATGDAFIEFKGGMVVIKYTAIGEQTVMDLALNMKR